MRIRRGHVHQVAAPSHQTRRSKQKKSGQGDPFHFHRVKLASRRSLVKTPLRPEKRSQDRSAFNGRRLTSVGIAPTAKGAARFATQATRVVPCNLPCDSGSSRRHARERSGTSNAENRQKRQPRWLEKVLCVGSFEVAADTFLTRASGRDRCFPCSSLAKSLPVPATVRSEAKD